MNCLVGIKVPVKMFSGLSLQHPIGHIMMGSLLKQAAGLLARQTTSGSGCNCSLVSLHAVRINSIHHLLESLKQIITLSQTQDQSQPMLRDRTSSKLRQVTGPNLYKTSLISLSNRPHGKISLSCLSTKSSSAQEIYAHQNMVTSQNTTRHSSIFN